MEQGNYSVGLDIGTTKIVAIIGRENEYGKIEVLGTGRSKSLGVHRGVVNNITQTISSIQQAVEQAELNSGLKIGSVVVGIAGQHIRSLHHSDYITRPNSEEVIDNEDLDKLCNQVYKLVMLPGKKSSMCCHRSTKWMVNPRSKNPLECTEVDWKPTFMWLSVRYRP